MENQYYEAHIVYRDKDGMEKHWGGHFGYSSVNAISNAKEAIEKAGDSEREYLRIEVYSCSIHRIENLTGVKSV